jgi:hypothetical protein
VLVSTSSAGALYCGGGRGPTAEVAIQSAIDDAENSAEGDGLFTCTPVGEPQVFSSRTIHSAATSTGEREHVLQLTSFSFAFHAAGNSRFMGRLAGLGRLRNVASEVEVAWSGPCGDWRLLW